MAEEVYDFASGFGQTLAPALSSQIAAGVTGSAALSGAMAAAGPIGLVLGGLSALAGRRKRKRAKARARRQLRAARKDARAEARAIGLQSQQVVENVRAAGQQFGGTLSAGLTQAHATSAILNQHRVMQKVGLTRSSMSRSAEKAWRKKHVFTRMFERMREDKKNSPLSRNRNRNQA